MLEKQLEGAIYDRVVFGGGFRFPRTLTFGYAKVR
jgi:hypothetical protein